MHPEWEGADPRLDQALHDIRQDAPDPAVADVAARRVWMRLEPESRALFRTCAEFQQSFAEYRAGALPQARALLVKDHLHECVACRKVFQGSQLAALPRPGRGMLQRYRWAIAAGISIVAALAGWTLWNQAPLTAHAAVRVLEGDVYRVSGASAAMVRAGSELAPGGEIRTVQASGAVLRTGDGSMVEMRERTGLRVAAGRNDLTIHLLRGSIIVQAAKRRSGHLYVATPDCRVAVTGTVFSVDSGLKGSRVAVLEGQVQVAQAGTEKMLRPGEQYASSPSLTPVSVEQNIAWSRNFNSYLTLVRTFSAINERLEQVHFAAGRYDSRLLAHLSADTVLYASLPNLGRPLGEAQQVLRTEAQDNPVLSQWWQQNGAKLEDAITKIRSASDLLGPEIVFAAALKPAGQIGSPVMLAEIKGTGFREFLNNSGLGEVRVVENAADLAGAGNGQPLVFLGSGFVAMSPDAAAMQQLLAPGGLSGTPFGSYIASAYRNGVGIFFTADLERIRAARPKKPADGALAIRYFTIDQKEAGGSTDTRAVLQFTGPRTGIASWLAPPAPLGALDYITPEATLVSAAAVKTPTAIVDEFLSRQQAAHPEFQKNLAEAESKLGVSIRSDLAQPLGSEFAVALDGPVLPTLSWKAVVEVYDPARLEWTIERLVAALNQAAAEHGRPPVQLKQEAAGGRTYYTLLVETGKGNREIHYVMHGGYLIAAPNRALLDRAIEYRGTGYTLPRSAAFTALLPHDHYPNFSAIFYQNAGPALAPLLQQLPGNTALDPQQRQSLQQFAAGMKPLLVAAYGEPDRITLATSGSLLGMGLEKLGLMQFFGKHHGGTRPGGAAYR